MRITPTARTTSRSSWSRGGDFHDSRAYSTICNRLAEYKCLNHSSLVDSIALCGYVDGNFQIIVTAKDKQRYIQLSQGFVDAGFPQPEPTDASRMTIRITTNQRDLITCFFLALSQADPTVGLIKDELIETIARIPDNNSRKEADTEAMRLRFQLMVMALRNVAAIMCHIYRYQNLGHVGLTTPPKNNERRLIVCPTENRAVLHRENTAHKINAATIHLLMMLQLMAVKNTSAFIATVMGHISNALLINYLLNKEKKLMAYTYTAQNRVVLRQENAAYFVCMLCVAVPLIGTLISASSMGFTSDGLFRASANCNSLLDRSFLPPPLAFDGVEQLRERVFDEVFDEMHNRNQRYLNNFVAFTATRRQLTPLQTGKKDTGIDAKLTAQ